jgi:hypothetical protein
MNEELSTERALRAPNRNGHARVVGEIVELLRHAPPAVSREPIVFLTRDAEESLRDADDAQLGRATASRAREASRREWRDLLRAHIWRTYGLTVVFEALHLHVE